MFETNVIVAPNSPIAFANDNTIPARMPGKINGNVMVAKTKLGCTPKVSAACSSFGSTASIASRIARTINGKAMIAAASTAPVHWNAITIPKMDSNALPTVPVRPNKINRTYPVTTGGSTNGKCTIAFRKLCPQNRLRANA